MDYLYRGNYVLHMHAYADPKKRSGTPEWHYRQVVSRYALVDAHIDLRAELEMRGLHEMRAMARRSGQYLARVEWEWLLIDDDYREVNPQPLPPGVAVVTDGNAA